MVKVVYVREDPMSVSRRDPQRSFLDVSFLAENLFDGTDSYSLFRRGFEGHPYRVPVK